MPPVPSRSFRDFSTRRVIVEKVVDRRLGHESLDPPTAWKWDYRYVVEDKIPETLPFPGLKRSHLLRLPRTYWQNGPVSGRETEAVKVTEVREVFAKGRVRWAPVIHNGDLNLWRDSTFLFSDDSVVELLGATELDSGGRSLHILQRTLRSGSPVLATIFRRDRDNEYLPWRSYVRRQIFTSILDSDGNEQTTRDGDTFYWSNVDTTKREFVSYVRDEQVYCLFNQFALEAITSTTVPSVLSDFNDLEYLGTSDGTDDQKFETDFFPVSDDSDLAVYVVNVAGSSWNQYTVVDEFTAVNQVQLDADLGTFTFGNSTGSTPPPVAGYAIYVAYNATVRIEYEEDGYGEETLAVDADVSPLGQSMNRGFVTLARSQLDIASIVLETTKDAYPGVAATYGPVYVGADYASLVATVYSSSGQVVPNVEVTFYFDTSPSFGGLGGSSTSIQRRTGFDGRARTFYIPPSSLEDMGFYVSSIGAGNTLVLSSDANILEEEDVYTYYVLKDDPFIGIPGADTSIGEVEWSETDFNGRKVVLYKWDAAAINPISGHLGAYVPIRPSSITNGYTLAYTDTLATPDPTPYGPTVETGTITSSGMTWIRDTTKSWTTNEWNGHIVFLGGIGGEGRRVLTNTSDTLTLSSGFSTVPSGSFRIVDRTNNLGAYWVVSDRFITIRASAYSPKQGRTIYSNLLSLRVEIPEYMKGSYISDSLQEIPFGWRIVDDTYEQASAIDGATFISINPVAGPYPIVDVIGGDTWDDYSGGDDAWWPYSGYPGAGASAPFGGFSIYWNSVP